MDISLEVEDGTTWTDREMRMLGLMIEAQWSMTLLVVQIAEKTAEVTARSIVGPQKVASVMAPEAPSSEELARLGFEQHFVPLVTKHLPNVKVKLV